MTEDKNYIYSTVLTDKVIAEIGVDKISKETYLLTSDSSVPQDFIEDERKNKLYPAPYDKSVVKTLICPSDKAEYDNERLLYEDILAFIDRYVIIPDNFKVVVAVYVMMTWVYDRFNTVPFLRVIGDFGTGKTRFLDTVGAICYRTLFARGTITQAVIFRTLDLVKGTLSYDEADFKYSDMTSGLVKIINSSNSKNAYNYRMVEGKGKGLVTESFNTYGPKIFATRTMFSDLALESRFLTCRLHPIEEETDTPIQLDEMFEVEALKLRNKLLTYRFRNYFNIGLDKESVVEVKFKRLRQTSVPITSIAYMLGQDVLDKVLVYLKEYEIELMGSQLNKEEADILIAIRILINEETHFKDKRFGRLYMQDIADKFNVHFSEEYGLNTNQYDKSRVYMTGKKVGVFISEFGIKKSKDGKGVYIDIPAQEKTIISISKKHGITNEMFEKAFSSTTEDAANVEVVKPEEIPW